MLNPKIIRLAVKEGYGTLYLIKRYGLSGEAQLFGFIERWFTESDRIIAALKKINATWIKRKET